MNPSPRKIKLFEEALKQLNDHYDIIRIKNDFDELHAYNRGRDFFLEHKEYTHMAILPDDLLVYPDDVKILEEDVNQFDFDITAGICNFAYSNKKFFNHMSVVEMLKYEAAETIRRTGKFRWPGDVMTRERFQELRDKPSSTPRDRLIRCAHIAFSFPIIRRDIVEQLPFTANPMGVDTAYSKQCLDNNIDMFADLRVELLHMKGMEFNREMGHVIDFAFQNSIDTLVHKGTLTKPMVRSEIFLERKIKQIKV